MDHNEAEILRIKKGRVFEAEIQFYSLGILISKDYYSSRACTVFFFFIHFSLYLLILTSISFSFLVFFYLFLTFFFSSFLCFSLFSFFSMPLVRKMGILSLINHPHISLSFIPKICPLYRVDPFQY